MLEWSFGFSLRHRVSIQPPRHLGEEVTRRCGENRSALSKCKLVGVCYFAGNYGRKAGPVERRVQIPTGMGIQCLFPRILSTPTNRISSRPGKEVSQLGFARDCGLLGDPD